MPGGRDAIMAKGCDTEHQRRPRAVKRRRRRSGSVEHPRLQLGPGDLHLGEEVVRLPALVLGGAVEQRSGIFGRRVSRAHPEHLATARVELLQRARKVEQQGAGCPQRIATDTLDGKDRQPGFDDAASSRGFFSMR